MIPLVDIHCHLLAGLDDGPGAAEDALEMCRIAWEEGTRVIAATAHINERWPTVTPDRIRGATKRLTANLRDIGLPITAFPCAEVMVWPGLEEAWMRGELLSMADRQGYLLIELPTGLFLDLRQMVDRLVKLGVRPILAHPERHPEFLHGQGIIDELIHLGCLVQVSSQSITNPKRRGDSNRLKEWLRRGIVHFVGSDGHSPTWRPPRMLAAYHRIAQWAGESTADRLCSTNGLAVLEGMPLKLPRPEPERRKRRWFSRLW